MSFEPIAFPAASAPSPSSHAISPAGLFLSDVSDKPLSWLWPGRIPLGHLTLLDAAPGCDPSLLALTLAACVSSGKPFPDGTPAQPGCVILYAPYDSAFDTLKPRLQAAGGDPSRVLLYRPPIESTSKTTPRVRALALPGDLEHLSSIIRCLEAQLIILDPASAIPGLSRWLPDLIDLAQQTNCAILLLRSLNKPPADPLRSANSPSPLHEAARSRLLLLPDPADERHHLLLTTRHLLSPQLPAILAYDLLFSEAGIPNIHWLDASDYTRLARLSTAPLHSPHRQAILRFLQSSASPQGIPAILKAACYDPEAGRKMLVRMKLAGELVSPARGLYTTADHPSLTSFTTDSPPVQNVTITPDGPLSALLEVTTTLDTPSSPVHNVTTSSPAHNPAPDTSPQADPPAPQIIPLADQFSSSTPIVSGDNGAARARL